jgi:hypothetical protein
MRTIILLLLLSSSSVSFSQKIKPIKSGKLPSAIRESSGLIIADSNSVWTINDSGGRNELYKVDLKGNMLQSCVIKNAENHDWKK